MHYRSLKQLKEMWAHTGFQKYLHNTGWMFAGRLASMAVSFFVTTYLARMLGPEQFGQLGYAVSVIGLFGFIAALGTDGILNRELTKHPEQSNALLGTTFVIRLASGLLATILTAGIAFFFIADPIARTLIYILAGTFVLSAFNMLNFEFQARVQSKYGTQVLITSVLILNALKLTAIISGYGIIAIASILLLEPVLYGIGYLYCYIKKLGGAPRAWTFSTPHAKLILSYGLLTILMNASVAIYARIDQVIIKHLLNAAAVGVYDAAVRIAELWTFIPGIILASLYPAVVNAHKHSEALYLKRVARLGALLFLIATGIAATVTIFAPRIIMTLYGPAFVGAIPVLRIYSWAIIGTFMGVFTTQHIFLYDLKKILVITSVIPMLVNVALNLIWVPTYGIIGAAYATLIAYSLAPLSVFFFKETRVWVVSLFRAR